MLINIPSAEGLNEIALRLHFDAWHQCIQLMLYFSEEYGFEGLPTKKDHGYVEEWEAYIENAQSELGGICMKIQQSAELRLKSIICTENPVFLLLNGNVKFGNSDIDFSELRTLDAVDLPNAVRSLTSFSIKSSYLEDYGKMRRLRNQVTHLGSHESKINPDEVLKVMCQQYISLWPDGRWLYRRVKFDGNSARNHFHDNRYSSSESTVMLELPLTLKVMDNETFKKSFGFSKGKLKGFCPNCMSSRASKWDADGHETAYRTSKNAARCAMCERDITISVEDAPCTSCDENMRATTDEDADPICFNCGSADP